MPNLRIGTCSWKYESWKGIVYSRTSDRNFLSEYSRKFDTVEVDQWFWSLHAADRVSLPDTGTVREYADSVPPDFRFSIKVPNSVTLTHFYKKSKADPLVPNPHFLSTKIFRDFLKRIEPLGKKTGPLLFQFEYLNKLKMPTQKAFQEAFGKFIRECPGGFQYGLEIRNPNYLNGEFFSFMEEHGLCPVFLQGYYMPPVFNAIGKYAGLIRNKAVIRLHGPDREGIEERAGKSWDRIVDPKDLELERIAGTVKSLLARDVSVYINVNNHYEGSAPLTIEKLRKLLRD
jgi:uncharacterized protein YecE (DUF72 family)